MGKHTQVAAGFIGLAMIAAALALSAAGGAAAQNRDGGPSANQSSLRFAIAPGGWSWFADPRAVYSHGRTYVGWVSRGGKVVVASYDRTTRVQTVLGGNPNTDDHDNPALLVRADGRLTAFYAHHNRGPMRYRTTVRPSDATAWGPERVLHTNTPGDNGWTYPNPIFLPSEHKRTYLFWRGGNWKPSFAIRGASGHWSRARTLITGSRRQRPYIKFATNGRDAIYFAFTRSHPQEGKSGIYFGSYSHGTFYGAGGRRIGSKRSLPLRVGQTDAVYRPGPGQSTAWVHDVAISRRHHPVIVYAVFPTVGNHLYRYARWNGRRWENHSITHAGGSISLRPSIFGRREFLYSPGISLNHKDPSVVYLSRKVGGVREIERWRTPNGGRSWRRQAITRHSPVDNVRPVVPRDLPRGQKQVIWMRGVYGSYTTFHTNIRAWLARSSAWPVADFATTARGNRTMRLARLAAPDGAASASWSFGDGSSGRGDSVEHRYARPGNYFVKLTVTDALGRRDVLVQEVSARFN